MNIHHSKPQLFNLKTSNNEQYQKIKTIENPELKIPHDLYPTPFISRRLVKNNKPTFIMVKSDYP